MNRQDREDQQATTHDETEGLNPRASPIGVAAPPNPGGRPSGLTTPVSDHLTFTGFV
jgi:hypothetical protein